MPPPNNAITRAAEEEMDATQRYTPTQPTQGTSHNSAFEDADLADVLCILHPCSPAAFAITKATAALSPQHVLQDVTTSFNDGLSQVELEDQETFILNGEQRPAPLDLALRFSSKRINPTLGFVFGRNRSVCDIIIGTDTIKRVSNVHFRIYINSSGVCMLEDLSTNGTVVDEYILKGKSTPYPATRMLNGGSIIEILSPKADEAVKFILRIPSREKHMGEFTERFTSYMQEVALAEAEQAKKKGQQGQKGGVKAAYPRLAATGNLPMVRPPLIQNAWGMHWNGGEKYNVVGHLGKGAFATVYRLATKADGQLYAAKELEKRRFMKNGILDRKLDNELQIMRTIDHPHVVQYVDYQNIANHLYIIMEYVPCGDLQQWLGARGPLPEILAQVVAEQVLGALSYLHRKMITHRDIKPDNILIANDSIESFSVKLSDFGLSKVVKDNETFLKTFCGTLLYCAPEVFPHYDNYLAASGKGANKRKIRKGGTPTRPKYHMYSQSVDIWSLGGVLWFAMCLKPPFEGVADATGRGMFDKIMKTPLDPTPLIQHGIADAAIDLLTQMLDTDPAERPTPEKCLLHDWFEDRTQSGNSQEELALGLDTIEEDEEYEDDEIEDDDDDYDGEDNTGEGAAPDFSQLSLHDGGKKGGPRRVESSQGSSDLEFIDPRQSKRFKTGANTHRHPTSQPRVPSQQHPVVTLANTGKFSLATPPITQGRDVRPLFGEIQPSYLKSSGVFGMRGTERLPQPEVPSASSSAYASSTHPHEQLFASAASRLHGGDVEGQNGPRSASSYLHGAETDLRDLNMDSPADSADSPNAEINEPQTPRTPDNAPQASLGQASTEETPKPAEITPKEPKYSRQISIPISASYFYNPNDPSTHNPEYASSISGYDFISHSAMPAESFHSLPPTVQASNISPSSSTASEIAAPPQPIEPEFIRPAPRLGRLSTTANSFTDITLNLSSRVTSWGRTPSNTFVYPLGNDTRIPKVGIILYFHANGIEEAERSGKDWTKLPGLHCLISTGSRLGIKVNGVKLLAKDKDERKLWGRVYTGDIVTICEGAKSTLEFECAFNHGEGRERRREGENFHINREEKSVGASGEKGGE